MYKESYLRKLLINLPFKRTLKTTASSDLKTNCPLDSSHLLHLSSSESSFYLHLATSLSLFIQHKSDCSDQTVSCENNSFFSRWQGVNVSAGVVGVVTFLRRSTAAHVARADTSFIYARPTCGLDPKVFQTTLGGGVRYIYTCIKKIRIQTHSFVHWLHSYCSHRSKSRPLKMSVDVSLKTCDCFADASDCCYSRTHTEKDAVCF